jgi:5-oxoprolinase (ATP-hydrolysing)
MANKFKIFADRGGTFTDLVAITPDNQIIIHKLLSENPEQYQDAVIQGIKNILEIPHNRSIPSEKIEVVKVGTTVATNALLERKGDPTVLLITKGFKDALRIGYQNRPDIFALEIKLPEMLYKKVIEIEERYNAQGEELLPVNYNFIPQLEQAYQSGIRSCAIVLMHSYLYPSHELQVGEIAKKIGFTQISISHQISPLIKLVSRGDTTVVDAYLSPILKRYINNLARELTNTKLMFMQSNGGLTDAHNFQGKDSILSGPAGGIIGAVKTSLMAGIEKIITFDMGGTSTDVAHFNGEYERSFETEIAGVRLCTPMMSIHTVAAGGGSIIKYDNFRYQVGPESAGANPGPACYRKGGKLTITDCNLLLRKIQPQFFPKVFGIDNNLPLDEQIVKDKFNQLAIEIKDKKAEQIAEGFISIAVENMANAIKKISLQRGYDVSEYTLCCFGGAGGQHACLIADSLGMKRIFIHPYAGVLSAYGIGLADVRIIKQKSVERELNLELLSVLKQLIQELEIEANSKISPLMKGYKGGSYSYKVNLKYLGTDSSLTVNFQENIARMREEFEKKHLTLYGFLQENKELIVELISVELIQEMPTIQPPIIKRNRPLNELSKPIEISQIFTQNSWYKTPIYLREDLEPEDEIIGTAIIVEKIGTIIIEPNWKARLTNQNGLILEKV